MRGSEDSEKGIKDDEKMESPNILMSQVHISIHTTVDGRQSVNHLPLFRKNWLWDPLQFHEIFPITYC